MTDIVNLVARLRAFESGRAVLAATHLQMLIREDSLIICPIAMAGEDTTLHAVAIGRIGLPPTVRVVPDPRIRDDQYEMVEWLGQQIEDYYQQCRNAGEFPQIWVPSSAAAQHLGVLADRWRFVRDNAAVKRVGELLTFATERYPITGQQALMSMTGAIKAHYATGQQGGEDEHLGTLLVWLSPPANSDIHAALAVAELQVMGIKTDPSFDRDVLQPRVSQYHQARKAAASKRVVRSRAKDIEDSLAPIVTSIYEATQAGFTFLIGRLPPAGVLVPLADHEAAEFSNFMSQRDLGIHLPYRDKPVGAAFKMADREFSIQSVQAEAIFGDDLARARARLVGDVLSGTVAEVSATKVLRKTIHRFMVETSQSNLHIREGDVLANLDEPQLQCRIEGVSRIGAVTKVALCIVGGMRSATIPANAMTIELGAPPPNWYRGGERKKMSARLKNRPWTHNVDGTAPDNQPRSGPCPADWLQAIEDLR
ncbi:MAG TPA: hypothetical protein VGH91_12610 [Gammaproteobacteria bacterium]|jgi:hypothetical protein